MNLLLHKINIEPIILQTIHHSPTSQPPNNTSTTTVPLPSHPPNVTKCQAKSKLTVTDHTMQIRAKNGIFKPKKLNLATKYPLPNPIEPTCVFQEVKSTKWK